jgi:hypothetical protein
MTTITTDMHKQPKATTQTTVRALGVDWPAPRTEQQQPITHADKVAAVKQIGRIWESNAPGGLERAREAFAPAMRSDVGKVVDYAAILAWFENQPENLSGPAEYAEHLCNALGVDVPVKVAPWKLAYEAWSKGLGWECNSERGTWQAAVEWCVEQIAVVSCGPKTTGEIITRRIMGQEQQL